MVEKRFADDLDQAVAAHADHIDLQTAGIQRELENQRNQTTAKICEVCKKKIPQARQEAMPGTQRCVTCAD